MTTDSGEAVQHFYRTELLRLGWEHDVGDDTSVFVRYVNRQACPLYSFSVETQPQGPQNTRVTLGLGDEQCGNR